MRGRAIRPEWQLLIDLCLEARDTSSLDGADTAALAGLAGRLNVESCVLEALSRRRHRLEPAASRWQADLRQRVFAVAVDNLRRDEELREALARMGGEGIPLILLKGSALRAARPGLAGRYQCDVDVLLRRPDLERAEAVLTGMGFVLDESYLDREGLLDGHFHLGYQRRGATVELHWDIDVTSPPGFTGRLWERSREVAGGLRVLAPEHQLLVACLHLSRHAFCQGLRWLADLKLLLPLAGEERERFAAEARSWPGRAVYAPLWFLACRGVAGSEDFPDCLEAGPAERRLLYPLLVALLVGEPWLGLPAWRGEKALHAWLFSERSLLGLLSGVWGEGLLRRWQAPEGAA
ncbi:MAG TPA: nucleotidyltransferase family protein [Thermoanaerobaculia bacterium]